jgi:hypothetical protein
MDSSPHALGHELSVNVRGRSHGLRTIQTREALVMARRCCAGGGGCCGRDAGGMSGVEHGKDVWFHWLAAATLTSAAPATLNKPASVCVHLHSLIRVTSTPRDPPGRQ